MPRPVPSPRGDEGQKGKVFPTHAANGHRGNMKSAWNQPGLQLRVAAIHSSIPRDINSKSHRSSVLRFVIG